MIVSESDLLMAALDRRLQVDGLLAVDPLGPITRSDEESSAAPSQSGPSASSGAASTDPIAARLPLGQRIDARVIAVPSPDHVIAEIEGLVVELSWPEGSGPPPAAGGLVSLRVLSHSPLLLFESAGAHPVRADDESDTPTRLSEGALRLQGGAAGSSKAIRFTAPILDIEVEEAGATTRDGHIPLDDVIVARSARMGSDPDPASSATANRVPASGLPLLLEGPAWRGQPVELVVRREREDEAFDNPVLDQWCGDLVIDLPRLGRVAGHLAWSMQGLRVRLEGQDRDSVGSMNAATGELAMALASVDLPVLSLSVGRPLADATDASADHG